MNIIVFTPSSHVEKFKQQARKLKRELGITHHEALDQVAKKYHYLHWHHVTEMAAITEPSENAYRQGLLIAFDFKEADSFDDELFIEDRFAPLFCEEELWKIYLEMDHGDDEDDGDFHKLPEPEQREYFQEYMNNLIFYRYGDKNTPTNIEDTLKLINEYSFWMPDYVWLKGKLCNTYGAPATDQDGNVVGIRF